MLTVGGFSAVVTQMGESVGLCGGSEEVTLPGLASATVALLFKESPTAMLPAAATAARTSSFEGTGSASI